MKNIKNIKTSKVAIISSLIGIGSLLLCIWLDIKYPNPLFTILGIIGLVGVFMAAFLYISIYIREVKTAYDSKDKYYLLGLIALGIVFVLIYLYR